MQRPILRCRVYIPTFKSEMIRIIRLGGATYRRFLLHCMGVVTFFFNFAPSNSVEVYNIRFQEKFAWFYILTLHLAANGCAVVRGLAIFVLPRILFHSHCCPCSTSHFIQISGRGK